MHTSVKLSFSASARDSSDPLKTLVQQSQQGPVHTLSPRGETVTAETFDREKEKLSVVCHRTQNNNQQEEQQTNNQKASKYRM